MNVDNGDRTDDDQDSEEDDEEGDEKDNAEEEETRAELGGDTWTRGIPRIVQHSSCRHDHHDVGDRDVDVDADMDDGVDKLLMMMTWTSEQSVTSRSREFLFPGFLHFF